MAEAIPLLVADDDADILDSMAYLLRDEGYLVTTASSLAETLDHVERETFASIITDLFVHSPHGIDELGILRDAAYPTPVCVTSAWQLAPTAVTQAGFVCFIAKPFDVDDLLSAVAAAIARPMTSEQQSQARVVRAFLGHLSDGNWAGATSLCVDDIVYTAPYGAPDQGTVTIGRAALRAYLEDAATNFPQFHIDDVRIVPTPRGLAARFTSHWGIDGVAQTAAGVVVEFDAQNHVQQIGLRVNVARVQALLRAR